MTKNKFVYVNYANNMVATNLLYWQDKIQDYLIEFYDGNRNNALGTKFGDCANICLNLLPLSVCMDVVHKVKSRTQPESQPSVSS